MSDAPERIWAMEWRKEARGKHLVGGYTETPAYQGCTEYIRADLHAAAIARAERAEAAARNAHLALIEAERFRVHAMTHLRDNGEFVGRDELLSWGDGLGVRCRFALTQIAALKGGAA